jgi:hypothetical protein
LLHLPFYGKVNENDSLEVKEAKNRLSIGDFFQGLGASELEKMVMLIERDKLRKIFDGESLQFSLH